MPNDVPRYMSTTLLSKTLTPSVPVGDRAPIGRPMNSLIPADAKLVEQVDVGGRVFERYSSDNDSFGSILRHYPSEVPGDGFISNEVIRFDKPGTSEFRSYLTRVDGDGASSGKVEYFLETTPNGQRTLSDWNRDGKVDWVSEPVADLPGFRIEGYDPAWNLNRAYNRVLEDTNKDGTFDTEAITGDWWTRTK